MEQPRSRLLIEGARTLSSGDRGQRVEYAQRALARKGFYEGPVDGRYGIVLSKAVRRFQAAAGIKVTGDVNPRTWEALFGKRR